MKNLRWVWGQNVDVVNNSKGNMIALIKSSILNFCNYYNGRK